MGAQSGYEIKGVACKLSANLWCLWFKNSSYEIGFMCLGFDGVTLRQLLSDENDRSAVTSMSE